MKTMNLLLSLFAALNIAFFASACTKKEQAADQAPMEQGDMPDDGMDDHGDMEGDHGDQGE